MLPHHDFVLHALAAELLEADSARRGQHRERGEEAEREVVPPQAHAADGWHRRRGIGGAPPDGGHAGVGEHGVAQGGGRGRSGGLTMQHPHQRAGELLPVHDEAAQALRVTDHVHRVAREGAERGRIEESPEDSRRRLVGEHGIPAAVDHDGRVRLEATAKLTGNDPALVEHARQYGYAFVGEQYLPHITLGYDARLAADGTLAEPVRAHEMRVERVALARLGRYGVVQSLVSFFAA